MAALASIDDWTTITGSAPADPTRVARLLEMASDAVLAGAHGQAIVSAERTATVRPFDGIAYLPQRPVTEVAEVLDHTATVIDPTGYRWEQGGDRRPARLVRRTNGIDDYWTVPGLTVTYTAGWARVPGQVVAAVVAMVVAAMDTGGGTALIQETAGPFSATVAEAQLANLSLTPSTVALLHQLCGVDGPSSVPIVRDVP